MKRYIYNMPRRHSFYKNECLSSSDETCSKCSCDKCQEKYQRRSENKCQQKNTHKKCCNDDCCKKCNTHESNELPEVPDKKKCGQCIVITIN